MNKIKFLAVLVSIFSLFIANAQTLQNKENQKRTIFAYGGEVNEVFLKYIISLTNKENPKICFLPTASAENVYYINYWYELCSKLPLKPSVLRLFVNSSPDQQSFQDILLQMDAIVVGGGNTLNMIAIWKAQGIDTVLRKAYDKGIILAGGSAGSLCWFKNGISDSRPQKLSIVECLNFINASHCPHYTSEKSRKPLYQDYILNNKLSAGYACDDMAGMLFQNEKLVKAVSLNNENHVYFISSKSGKIDEKIIDTEIIK